jgi:cobalt/nickel transport system ATP-binding protein
MSHHIVEAKNLSYVYPDGTVGLRDVSFRITHGEATALVGANGAGKSTLLLHLVGCLFPTKGSIQIGDTRLTKKNVAQARRAVGMVFQDPDDQLFMPTVLEDVAFGPLNLGMSENEALRKSEEVLAVVGAAHLINRPSHKLSGGEKRSVSIAAVLALAPDILVMDEPSSNLDARSRRRLISLLQSFAHTRIIATHDLDLAMEVCSRVILMHEGGVAADGPIAEIFNDEESLMKYGLEKPLRMQKLPVVQ